MLRVSEPGVLYRIESSHDLKNWTAGDEIYGLGHEVVTAMREFTPPPPSSPGSGGGFPASPHPLVRLVGLRFQPSSDVVGGTVVSWRSLDSGGPMITLLNSSMSPDWSAMPFCWQSYGSHSFFIAASTRAIPAPAETPGLGTLDAAMFAQLTASFADMNLAVENSVALARNTPPPAPPDPNSKKFWRVYCDWGIDTDNDGTPDWMEFEMAANDSAASGPRADAFNADTDGNGIRDGEEMDFDHDGIADAQDIGKGDSSATFTLGPIPRYALFPIQNAQPITWLPAPLQISDRGTVLYANGTWSAGTWKPLGGAWLITASTFGLSPSTTMTRF